MDLEIRHLRLIEAIAETESVTRASERLHLSQSALSHQLRDIEDRLAASLFHRVGKRMILTPAGEETLRAAKTVLDIVRRTEDGIRGTARGRNCRLRISTQCYTCYHWLPAILREYRVQHPTVDVEINAEATTRPVGVLLDGRLDVAIISDRVRDARVVEHPLFDDDLVAIVAPGHRLASQPFIAAEDFIGETVIVYPPIEDSTLVQRVLAPARVTPGAIQLIQLTEAIIELVKADLGIGVMAHWAVRPHVDAGTLRAVKLTRKGYRRHWTAATLRGMASVPHVRDFITLLAQRAPAIEARVRKSGVVRFENPARVRGRTGRA